MDDDLEFGSLVDLEEEKLKIHSCLYSCGEKAVFQQEIDVHVKVCPRRPGEKQGKI